MKSQCPIIVNFGQQEQGDWFLGCFFKLTDADKTFDIKVLGIGTHALHFLLFQNQKQIIERLWLRKKKLNVYGHWGMGW